MITLELKDALELLKSNVQRWNARSIKRIGQGSMVKMIVVIKNGRYGKFT